MRGRGRKGAGGSMGREGKREREKERKKRRGKGKRRREGERATEGGKNQPTTNQPTVVTWQCGFSQSQKFCRKNDIKLHHRTKLTVSEGENLPMTTKRSFSGEHTFTVVQF